MKGSKEGQKLTYCVERRSVPKKKERGRVEKKGWIVISKPGKQDAKQFERKTGKPAPSVFHFQSLRFPVERRLVLTMIEHIGNDNLPQGGCVVGKGGSAGNVNKQMEHLYWSTGGWKSGGAGSFKGWKRPVFRPQRWYRQVAIRGGLKYSVYQQGREIGNDR